VLYTSGYDRADVDRTDVNFLQKPYSCKELVDAVDALMASGDATDLDLDLAPHPLTSPYVASMLLARVSAIRSRRVNFTLVALLAGPGLHLRACFFGWG
jgi:hypothetical protein